MAKIVIDRYTGKWDDACRHYPRLRAGMHVAISISADAREWDAFDRRVQEAGLNHDEPVRHCPRLGLDVYCLRRGRSTEELV